MMPLLPGYFFLQGVPPRALVLAMLLSYAMCFAGLIFAYLNYRKRKKPGKDDERGSNQP